jgi:NADP-dependent 3-hydroxy acid dehydrogenase YdfG
VGATSGIRRATAVMMAGEDARLMASGRRRDRLVALKEKLGAARDTFAANASGLDDPNRLAKETRNGGTKHSPQSMEGWPTK